MPYAGEIRFNTKIDNTQAQKDLDDLNRKIRKANEDISRDENAKLPLTNQAKELEAQLDRAVAKLEKLKAKQQEVTQILDGHPDIGLYMDAVEQKPELDAAVKEQDKVVADLRKKWDSINAKIEKYDLKIQQAKKSLEQLTAGAGRLKAQLTRCEKNRLPETMERARGSAKKFEMSIVAIAKRMLIFAVISAAFRTIKTYMDRLLKTNAEYTAELANLKGALATAFQPIYEILLPGLIAAMRIATVVVRAIAQILSFFTGKTASQSAKNAEALNKEADAIAAVGGAAKKANKDLAGFDEINRLGGNDTTGGGGAAAGTIAPDFGGFDGSDMTDILTKINDLVLDIGFAFLAWKVVGGMPQLFQSILGVLVAIGGALIYATNMEDAFLNGFDWENLTGMVGGLAVVVVGLALAFGSVGAAVGLLIGGVGLIMVALNEFMTTGVLTNEALAAIEIGILVVGAALALFTGSWIPLALAALVGFAIAAVAKTDEVKALLQRFDDWLQGVFARDWTEVFGPVLGGALNRFFDWAQGVWDGVKKILNGVIDFISGIFTGDWQKAWNGIRNIFSGVWEGFLGIIQPIFDGIASIWEELGNVLPESWKGAINAVVAMVNKFTSWLNSTLQWNMPPIKVGGVTLYEGGTFGLSLPQIPYLAQGAVIPPNREFLAVLGDQSHGTNVEAPLSTIQEAVAVVMEDMVDGMMAGFEALLEENRLLREVVEEKEFGDEAIYKSGVRYQQKLALAKGR